MACLKMAGAPAAQVSKGGERAGIQGQQRSQGHQGRARRDLMRPRAKRRKICARVRSTGKQETKGQRDKEMGRVMGHMGPKAHADEKWRCAKATVSQLKVPSFSALRARAHIRFACS